MRQYSTQKWLEKTDSGKKNLPKAYGKIIWLKIGHFWKSTFWPISATFEAIIAGWNDRKRLILERKVCQRSMIKSPENFGKMWGYIRKAKCLEKAGSRTTSLPKVYGKVLLLKIGHFWKSTFLPISAKMRGYSNKAKWLEKADSGTKILPKLYGKVLLLKMGHFWKSTAWPISAKCEATVARWNDWKKLILKELINQCLAQQVWPSVHR